METIYDFVVETNKGVTYKLDAYKGDVMLIVNTASECGFTSQFEGLQSLYEKYKDQGFVILGFLVINLVVKNLDQAKKQLKTVN